MKNPINGRESKKIIREVENLPEFLKSLSWTGGDFNIYTFVLFLEDHICRGKNCGNFTYLKCKKCFRSFCGLVCNNTGWPLHKVFCEDWGNGRNTELMVPKHIQAELQSICEEEIITFDNFFKELCYKLFESFYYALQTPAVLCLIRSRNHLASFDTSKIPMLVKKRGVESPSLATWRRQISTTYGPDTFLLDRGRAEAHAMILGMKYAEDNDYLKQALLQSIMNG